MILLDWTSPTCKATFCNTVRNFKQEIQKSSQFSSKTDIINSNMAQVYRQQKAVALRITFLNFKDLRLRQKQYAKRRFEFT